MNRNEILRHFHEIVKKGEVNIVGDFLFSGPFEDVDGELGMDDCTQIETSPGVFSYENQKFLELPSEAIPEYIAWGTAEGWRYSVMIPYEATTIEECTDTVGDLVPHALGCPYCGERRLDDLMIITDLTEEELKEEGIQTTEEKDDIYCTRCNKSYKIA